MALENPYLTSATLPASGAWTAQAPIELPASAKVLGLVVAYTGAHADGAVKLRIRRGITSAGVAQDQVLDETLTVSAPVASQSLFDQEVKRPVTGVTATTFALEIALRAGWRFIVVDLAEYGHTAAPGTASINATVGS
jgi:hypothetical protein